LEGDAYVDLGFAVLPMGCSHAVALAQEAHLEVLRRAGLPMDRLVCEGDALLTPGPFFAVCIDDLVVADPDGSDDTVEEWLRRALSGYEEAGLPVAERKVERGATLALGMALTPGEAAAPRVKRQGLLGALLAVGS